MPWRVAVVLVIVVLGFGQRPMSAGSTPLIDDGPSVRAAPRFENDNNMIEDLFQSFNGNESSDGGHKKKETIGPLPAPVSAPAPQPSATDTQARARAGRESVVFLTNDRVVLRVPSALDEDLEISILVIQPPPGSPPPGPVVGDLVFRVSAQPIGGTELTRLPIEANLSARYSDAELGGRDEGRLVLAWLDPSDNQWKPAPKPAADPRNNYLSATIQDLGVYAVHQTP